MSASVLAILLLMRDWGDETNGPPIFGFSLPYSGLGVSVTILDDGIEKDHPDLIRYFLQCQILQYFMYLIQSFPFCKKKILHNYFCRNYDPLSSTDVNDNDRYVTM